MSDVELFNQFENVGIVTLPICEVKIENDKTATASIIGEGWSFNGNYYSKAILEEFGSHLMQRPKMYLDHKYNKKEAMNRNGRDWVATAVGQPNVVLHENVNKLKTSIEFTELDIGRQYHAQAVKRPESIGVSINALVGGRKGEMNGRKGNIIEAVGFLFSADIVGYASAKGGIDKITEDMKFEDTMEYQWLIGEGLNSDGMWKMVEENKKINMTTDDEILKYVEEAFQSLDAYMKARKVRDYFYDLWYAMTDLMRGILNDTKTPVANRKVQLDKLMLDFTTALSAVDLGVMIKIDSSTPTTVVPESRIMTGNLIIDIKETDTNVSEDKNNNQNEDGENMDLKDILADSALLGILENWLITEKRVVKTDVHQKVVEELTTVKELVKTITGEKEKLETSNKEMKSENEKKTTALDIIKKESIYNQVVEELVAEKDSKFSRDYVKGDYYKDNISGIEFKLEEEDKFKEAVKAKLKARQEDIQELVKNAGGSVNKDNGTTTITEEQKAEALKNTPIGKFFDNPNVINNDNGNKVTTESIAGMVKN